MTSIGQPTVEMTSPASWSVRWKYWILKSRFRQDVDLAKDESLHEAYGIRQHANRRDHERPEV